MVIDICIYIYIYVYLCITKGYNLGQLYTITSLKRYHTCDGVSGHRNATTFWPIGRRHDGHYPQSSSISMGFPEQKPSQRTWGVPPWPWVNPHESTKKPTNGMSVNSHHRATVVSSRLSWKAWRPVALQHLFWSWISGGKSPGCVLSDSIDLLHHDSTMMIIGVSFL